ncbi:MAG TPA: TIGR00730 family Rossman fold protein [Candidatus Paceibacterota bacterium]
MDDDEKRLSIYRAEKALTAEEIGSDAKKRLSLINKEFGDGFEFINKYPKSVTFFGSSVLPESNDFYKRARALAGKIAKAGYTIVTGGGPGIMEAANRGAFEVGGQSIGLNIELPREQKPNPYLTEYRQFHYFFSRKVALTFAAEAYLFFPGGFGTLNELSEILMLIQTKRIKYVPVILVGKTFWNTLDHFIKKEIYEKHGMVKLQDVSLYAITDDDERILETIRMAPVVSNVPFKGK